MTIDTNDCWLWAGSLNFEGYGIARSKVDDKYLVTRVHRAVYEHYKGLIPADLVIDHLCRVRHCINPEHLEAVTNEENIRRGVRHNGGWPRVRTHCAKGHELTPDNIRIKHLKKTATPIQNCRECYKAGQLRWRTKNRKYYNERARRYQQKRKAMNPIE